MLYLECASGISGDMTVGALLDLGADREALQRALDSLPLEGFHTEITRVKKSAIDCCSFSVILDPEFENHDHDMAYLYGKTDPYAAEDSDYGHGHSHEEYGHDHTHEHGHEHSHEEYGHTHEHGHGEHTHTLADGTVITHTHEHTHGHSHAGGHAHRTLAEIEHILADCDMSDHALELAGRIFEILGDAEAKAHGVAPSEVHFHEVGAVDSIVDIVAAAVCLDSLHVQGVIVGSLTEGKGTVRTQHGVLPVPVPAVLNIAASCGLHLEIRDVQGEYVTPTGAAIAAAVRTADKLPARFTVCRTGYGAGKRTQELPSILRAMLILPEEKDRGEDKACTGDTIVKLETNIDDCSGETLGYVMERLLAAGARDVHYTPVFMKKNRPAWQLNIICTSEDADKLAEIVFLETTSIGIRRLVCERMILPREAGVVETEYGKVIVKKCDVGGVTKIYPEYDSVAELARRRGVPFEKIYWEVRK